MSDSMKTNSQAPGGYLELKDDFPELTSKENGGVAWAFLVLPLFLIFFMIILPVIRTVILSFTDFNGMGGSEFIGLKNYVQMSADKIFWKNFSGTFFSVINFLKYIIPFGLAVLTGSLAAKAGRKSRVLVHSLSGLNILGISVLSISAGLLLMINPGKMAENPGFLMRGFLSAEIAQIFFFSAIGLSFGAVIWASFVKGREYSSDGKSRASGTILLASALLIAVYSLQAFGPWSVLMQSAPLQEQRSLTLFSFVSAFRFLRFGYAAAVSAVLITISLILGLVAVFILKNRNIVLWNREKLSSGSGGSGTGAVVIMVILSLIVLFPVLKYFLFGFKSDSGVKGIPFGAMFVRTWLFIAFTSVLQTGIALLGGLALGRYRFPGRKFIIGLVLFTVFLSPSLYISRIYLASMRLRLLNHVFFPCLLIAPAGILLFKLFFEGLRIDAARKMSLAYGDQSVINRKNTKDTLLFCLFAMILFILFNINQILLPLVMIARPDTIPLTIFPLFTFGSLSPESGEIGSLAYTIGMLPHMIFCLAGWIFLQIAFFKRSVILDPRTAKVPVNPTSE